MACAAWWTYLEIDQTAFFAAIEQNARDSWRYCSAGSTTVNTSEFLFWLIFPMQSSCQKMKECLITATDNIPDSYYAWHPKVFVIKSCVGLYYESKIWAGLALFGRLEFIASL